MDEEKMRSAVENLRAEYEKSERKAGELRERLRELEKAESKSFNELWRTRDRLAYWEGRQEGISLALAELRAHH